MMTRTLVMRLLIAGHKTYIYRAVAPKKQHRGELGFEPRASRIYSQRPGKPEARIIPLDHTPEE